MAPSFSRLNRIALAVAACCTAPLPAAAQTSGGNSAGTVTGSGTNLAAATSTSTITITGRSLGGAAVTGFGDIPLADAPLQASVFNPQQLGDAGITSIGGLTRLDASLGDAYNAEGYWSIISARGYTLDNRFNYRRDGLPINAETAIALDNKDRLELLKGTSGIQAGTSAPGGIINLVVKRATGHVRNASLQVQQAGTVTAAVDIGERFGAEQRLGLRLNAAAARLDPQQRHTRGERSLLALAGDWQPNVDTVLQAEVESSHQSQPSVTGFSMLGNTVPAARSVDPRLNLNNQAWRQPVVLDGTTASLRLQQRLSADWTITAQAMQQRLKSDDRTAFPYGVYDPATDTCPQWCDRFAPDGSFTYWQFVSDNERRTSSALQVAVAGTARTAGVEHVVEAGVLQSRYRGRFQDQVFEIAGLGRIDGSLQTAPSPGDPAANTNRDERSTELFVRDVMRLSERWQLWAGLRHSRLNRTSALTRPGDDGSLDPTRYGQSVTVPWLAVARSLAADTVAYASWGQGLESDVAPNRSLYTNAGQALPGLKSRQWEAGVKHTGDGVDASLAVFDISRPQSSDIGPCNADATCTRAIDGTDRHRGVEASGALRQAAWTWHLSGMWLDAQRRGSAQAGVNGHRPVNVPAATVRAGAEYRVDGVAALAGLSGLSLLADLSADSNRVVLPNDDSVRIPGWARLDLGARWRQTVGSCTLLWRLGLDNATDRRAWKESPYQFSHVYLYPLAPRTWRASVQAAF